MSFYQPPVRDLRFLFEEVLEGARLQQLPGYEEVDADTVEAILEEAGKFCEGELQPINRNGDEEGCHFVNGMVTTPKGYKEAYQAFCGSGWNSIAMEADYGGQGLPKTIGLMIDEMMASTNMSFSLYPGLTTGAYTAMAAHASDEIKETYFPKMAEGTWSGTMCLTEPHCGTDLGLLRTKAIPNDDGSFRITGTKIFITAGEHDLTENILHLVLARTPDAPKGIKGISLFLVPKFKVGKDGGLDERNGVHCGSIEHKMGIKASATCVMNFDDAEGYLIGGLNKGMQAMFKMMNTERVAVGIQGLGIAEAAYQGAVSYAHERLQGRSLTGAKQPEQAADPLIVHPDVRRMLLTIRANTQGCRALAVWLGTLLDVSAKSQAGEQRKEAEELVALLTPVAKAFMTDVGFESAVMGQQVFGGHGYIREHGMEQLVRDARITQIYEGTNGVQAMDLVGRKLPAEEGRYATRFFDLVQSFIDEHRHDSALNEFTAPTAKALERLKKATGWLAKNGFQNPDHVGAGAVEYTRLFGLTVLAYLWARMSKQALAHLEGEDPDFYLAKVKTARFFMQRILPQTSAYYECVVAGGGTLMDFEDVAF